MLRYLFNHIQKGVSVKKIIFITLCAFSLYQTPLHAALGGGLFGNKPPNMAKALANAKKTTGMYGQLTTSRADKLTESINKKIATTKEKITKMEQDLEKMKQAGIEIKEKKGLLGSRKPSPANLQKLKDNLAALEKALTQVPVIKYAEELKAKYKATKPKGGLFTSALSPEDRAAWNKINQKLNSISVRRPGKDRPVPKNDFAVRTAKSKEKLAASRVESLKKQLETAQARFKKQIETAQAKVEAAKKEVLKAEAAVAEKQKEIDSLLAERAKIKDKHNKQKQEATKIKAELDALTLESTIPAK